MKKTPAAAQTARATCPCPCWLLVPVLTPPFTFLLPQSVLRDIERKVSDFQHQQRLRDAGAAEESARRVPVDVQVGDGVFEDAPQVGRVQSCRIDLHSSWFELLIHTAAHRQA